MQLGLHVTTEDKLGRVLDDGLRSRPPDTSWVGDRRSFHSQIDEYARQVEPDWVNRTGAVYFWTTLQDAIEYQRVFEASIPYIIEVQLDDTATWGVHNFDVEIAFDNYANGRYDNDCKDLDQDVENLVSDARVWNGERVDGLEVWGQPPIGPNRITKIYDRNGQGVPLESVRDVVEENNR